MCGTDERRRGVFSANRLGGDDCWHELQAAARAGVASSRRAGGRCAGADVDGDACRDDVGRRRVLYLSAESSPTPAGARVLQGPDGSWSVRRDGVVVLCARAPHAMLVVGQDEQLLASVARALAGLWPSPPTCLTRPTCPT